MPRLFKFECSRSDEDSLGTVIGEWEITVFYKFVPGRPATPPAYDHGGLPPDPAEIDIHSIVLSGRELDFKARHPDGELEFDYWRDWLDLHHYDDMLCQAEETVAAEREEAMERRAEERREERMMRELEDDQ